jgi:hypothetical protein
MRLCLCFLQKKHFKEGKFAEGFYLKNCFNVIYEHLDPSRGWQNAVLKILFQITMFEAYYCFA